MPVLKTFENSCYATNFVFVFFFRRYSTITKTLVTLLKFSIRQWNLLAPAKCLDFKKQSQLGVLKLTAVWHAQLRFIIWHHSWCTKQLMQVKSLARQNQHYLLVTAAEAYLRVKISLKNTTV